jgi:dUTP pyrophosphatase
MRYQLPMTSFTDPFIRFKLMREGARLPLRGTEGSGAFDLYAPENGHLNVGEKKLIPSGVAHELPGQLNLCLYGNCPEAAQNYLFPVKIQGFLFDRSGLGGKKGIRLSFACLIDNDYRGEIFLSIENQSDVPFAWLRGDRLVQIVYVLAYAGEAALVETLTDTHRGEGGFGSTGR